MADRNIQAVYPLTALQEGMLFHALRDAEPGVYLSQYICTLRGPLDEQPFRQSWEQTVERHATLRTFFTWERRERPLQVVRERVETPFEVHDWRDRRREEQERLWEDRLAFDRKTGFDLGRAPLVRLALFRLADEERRFLWSLHHTLLDGWSGRLVLREVCERYDALSAGREYVPRTAPEFAQYVTWLRGRDLSAGEKVWRDALAGFRAPTPLPLATAPLSSARPGSRGYAHLGLPSEATGALERACRRMRVTLNTLTLAAWSLLLGRHSGERDVVFGVAVAQRPTEIEGVEEVVGLLLNTVPLRVRIDSDAPVAEWLSSLQSELVTLREHDYAPLSEIQRWSEVLTGRAVFDSLVAFEKLPPSPSALAGGALTIEGETLLAPSNYSLALLAFPGERLDLTLVYADDRFSQQACERLLVRLATLLDGLADAGAQQVRDLPLLPADELDRLTKEWARAPVVAPEPIDVVERFEAWAAETPDALAVANEKKQLTYGELNRCANQLARRLRESSVGPGVFVAILIERSPEWIVAVLAVLKAGGAYVPLSVRTPAVRLKKMLEELGAQNPGGEAIVITNGTKVDTAAPTIDFDRDANAIAALDSGNLDLAASPADPAYVIYTSGSTGEPKGVVVERRNLAFSVAARLAYYKRPVQSFLLLSSTAVDSSIAGVYWALCSGAALITPAERAEQSVDGLVDLIERFEVSHTLALPSLYRLILENAPAERLRSLECVAVAGEECLPEVVRLHHATLAAELHNEYGPAEASVWATAAELRADATVTIGRPVPGALVYLLDDELRPAPEGVTGEIFLGGDGVARGYLRRPDLTDERFIKNPFEPGGRLYRTGDLGRWRADGTIEFLGRADRQVKVRGYRVELGELERALAQHPGVKEAAAVVAEPAAADEALATALERLGEREAEALLARVESGDGGATA